MLGVGAAALELAVTPVPSREGASPSVARVLAIARAEGAERGFASYWTAYPLVVRSRFVLDVAPVGRCNTGEPYRLCPMYLHYIDREYEPRAPRSFLLVDTLIGKRIRAFGPAYVEVVPDNMFPRAHYDVGDGFVMYVFDGDIAQNLLPNRELDDPRAGHGGPLEPSP